MKPLPIEDAFFKICSDRDEYLEYYHIYFSTKYILQKYYYPFIKDKNPYFTDHSISHINRVLGKLFDLLNPHLLTDAGVDGPYSAKSINADRMSKKLNAYELYLLLSSTLWHDVGNLYNRIGHEKNIDKYFEKAKDFLLDRTCTEWIEKICKAHSGNQAIEKNIDRDCKNETEFTFYPRFIAALLRLADELDEGKDRIGERLYEEIPKENKVYWFFCKCNDSIKIEEDHHTDQTDQTKIVIEGRIDKTELFYKYEKLNISTNIKTEIEGIEEYINRIDKINRERKYCGVYLKPHYFKNPNSVELRLRIYDKLCCLEEIKFRFDDLKGSTEFFDENNDRIKKYR